jgi:hypothetical protein
MAGHRIRANAMLGTADQPADINPPVQQQQQAALQAQQAALAPAPGAEGPTAPAPGASPSTGGGFDLSRLASIAGALQPKQQDQPDTPVPINIAQPPGLPAARNLAAIMQRLGQPT